MSTYPTSKAAAYLGVGVKTLQRWDREGRLKPERTPSGRRAYSKAMLDLTNQRRVLEDFCAARGVAARLSQETQRGPGRGHTKMTDIEPYWVRYHRELTERNKQTLAHLNPTPPKSANNIPLLNWDRTINWWPKHDWERYDTKLRKRLLGRIKRMQRRISLQKHRAKKLGLKSSRRQYKRQLCLSRLHTRIANIRKDGAHKLTTDLTRRFETIAIEDLNVSGMAKNHSLAGAVLDCGFHEIRRQFEYKAAMRNGRLVIANRYYPSTQACSKCGCLTGPKGCEELHIERWVCSECGTEHGRDSNAAIKLRNLGLAKPASSCGDTAPLLASASLPVSAADEPQTETVLTIEHI
jgi:DNA-binding transcriptional MerR regulator